MCQFKATTVLQARDDGGVHYDGCRIEMKNIWIPTMKVTGFTDELDMGYIKGIKFNFQVTGLSNW